MDARTLSLQAGLGVLCAVAPLFAAESTGTASDAQPGLQRVALAEAAPWSLAATLGYGYTEPHHDAPGSHRLSLRLAGAAAPLGWLNVAPAVAARHDLSSGDSSNVVEAALAARAFVPWRTLRLGAELKGWAPGAETAAGLADSMSLDARALFGAVLEQVRVSAYSGYRLDRSAAAIGDPASLAPADRVALGVSSFDALLVGAGAALELGKNELFGEVTADLLVGRGAPSATFSPLRVSLGGRRTLGAAWTAELVADVSLSRRAVFDAEALVPVEPRVSLLAGLRYRFGTRAPKAPARARPPAPPAKPVPVLAPVEATLELAVVDDQGAPVHEAKVVLTGGSTSRELPLDASGRARDEHVPVGAAKLVVTAAGFETTERSLVLEAGAPQKLDVELKALPPPSQVRGTIRSLSGASLVARVRIQPIGLEAVTNQAGNFELDVPAGNYAVEIEAEGYESQRRQITVDPQGVVILNADLTGKR